MRKYRQGVRQRKNEKQENSGEREAIKSGGREPDRVRWGETKNSNSGQLPPFLEHSPGTALPGASRNVLPAKALSWSQSCALILVMSIALHSGQD